MDSVLFTNRAVGGERRQCLRRAACKLYPGDDERRGQVGAADEAQAPVDLAAVTPQRHHERVEAAHAESGHCAVTARSLCRHCAVTARPRCVRGGNTGRSVR